MFTIQKGGHFIEVFQHFCPSVFKKLLGDNLSVRSFLYKNLFSLKFETGYKI